MFGIDRILDESKWVLPILESVDACFTSDCSLPAQIHSLYSKSIPLQSQHPVNSNQFINIQPQLGCISGYLYHPETPSLALQQLNSFKMGNYFCEQPEIPIRSSHRVSISEPDDNQLKEAQHQEPTKERQRELNQYMYSSVSEPLHCYKEDDFEKLREVGKGAFGLVYLVKLTSSSKYFAMKQISKKLIIKQNISDLVLRERKLMTRMKNNFIVKLFYAFQDKYNCTFVMEYAPGGDVCEMLYPKNLNSLSLFYRENRQPCSKFILACVILGLECLHTHDIHYRDLKPQNIMLMQNGYFKLIDFGLVRSDRVDPKSTAIAGTPLYFAPQVLKRESTRLSDLWSLGIFAYQLFLLEPPFRKQQILSPNYQNICRKAENQREWKGHLENDAKDLINGLLKVDPYTRLGAGDFKEVKNHKYFQGFKWEELAELKTKSPFEGRIEPLEDGLISPRPIMKHAQESMRDAEIRGFTFYYDK